MKKMAKRWAKMMVIVPLGGAAFSISQMADAATSPVIFGFATDSSIGAESSQPVKEEATAKEVKTDQPVVSRFVPATPNALTPAAPNKPIPPEMSPQAEAEHPNQAEVVRPVAVVAVAGPHPATPNALVSASPNQVFH